MVTTQVKVMRSCHKNPVATDKTNLKKPSGFLVSTQPAAAGLIVGVFEGE